MLEFSEDYFKTEEREGFVVSGLMKRAWAAQLEILMVIDEICSRYNIEYYADGGTLLGAIRHQGYIPWDDDIDIGMKRLDYVRFLNIASKELPQGYEVLSAAKSSGWNGAFSRIVNTNEIPLRAEMLQKYHGFPYTAGIDIFPMDYIPVDKVEEDTLLVLFRAAYTLAFNWDKEGMSMEEKMESLRIVEQQCNIKFTEDKPYQQQLWVLTDRIASMFWDTGADAKECALMYMLADRPEFRLPVSCLASTVRVPFENIMIPIPVGYKQLLTLYYGEEYMIPARGTADHEYPFYKKQQQILFEHYEKQGMEIPDYLKD